MAVEQPDLIPAPDADAWRRELAAKVSSYRARRPRAPRYPSLSLPFDRFESAAPRVIPEEAAAPWGGLSVVPAALDPEPEIYSEPEPHEPARIIEFPRPWTPPPPPLDQLAEPVMDVPRIMEVPEVVPPSPALGGMLIEQAEQPAPEKRPGFEIPLNSALLSQRLLAAAVDGAVVLAAFGVFAAVFSKFSPLSLPLPEAAATALPIFVLFWFGFKYLMLVHGGTTPGLRLAGLELSRFDGSPVPRRARQWRVAASLLSGVSLGLGYAWFFLDEDALCWHDRITRTYLAPRG
ncbi:MAG: RDD family protein [Acidobacteriales bacterium]|nr:RDD family protein [Terriglobales bacterium]